MADIYQLEVHEEVIIDSRNTALRVPGGWIYKSFSGQEKDPDFSRPIGMVFVPFSEEFEEYFAVAAKTAAGEEEEAAKKTEERVADKQRQELLDRLDLKRRDDLA